MTAGSMDANEAEIRARAVAAAKGDLPFDTLLINGHVADVITGQVRKADVGISGPIISSVHPRGTRNDAHRKMDAEGRTIAPGLIDAHMHVESSMVTPRTYGNAVLARGVTTLVWDPHEFGNVWGTTGVAWAVEQARRAPLRILVLAPSCVPSAPGLETSGADLEARALHDILAWPEIHGLAEVMDMQGVIDRQDRITAIVNEGLVSRKPVFGHARGLVGPDLNAFAAAGITSDHEVVSGEDLKGKLEAGFFVELRGSHDHLLPEFVRTLAEFDRLPPTLALCTDDVFPDELFDCGGLDDVVRRLAKYGMPPLEALRAATLNAAMRLGRHDLGAVAPGRRADLVVLESLRDFRANAVLFDGQPVSPSGDRRDSLEHETSAGLSIAPVVPEDFHVRSELRHVRVATIDNPRFTRWGEAVTDVLNDRVLLPADATLMAVINRHGAGSPPKLAYLRGWGKWKGAFCTTVSHDSHNLTVFGSNESDMATAANAVLEMKGGLAVAANGKITARLPLPVAGLVSDRPLSEVASGFRAVKTAMERVVPWNPPYLVFKACFGASLACNPGPHLTDLGIADAGTGKVLASPILGSA